MTDYIVQLVYKGFVAVIALAGITALGIMEKIDSEAVVAIYSSIVMYTLANGIKRNGGNGNAR